MPLIRIENLADFIEQTTRQVQEGCANLRSDGIIVVSPDEIQITCEVVREINAIASTTLQSVPEKVTTATDAPSTETTVQAAPERVTVATDSAATDITTQNKGISRSETNYTAAENVTVTGEDGDDRTVVVNTHASIPDVNA